MAKTPKNTKPHTEWLKSTGNMSKKKKKYVIRHYWRQWVDIVVEAENEEEAYELADEKYNEGDYEEEPDNFENTEVENVTQDYIDDKIPF